MHWIIGTAGHIDHGKTSLVKALTGTDTDRLKEEKERGISIDLGFASLALPDGTRAGVVDVPGHERFIKNMLAGAHGIDLVLFTVAADDGVMPQTEEHLDIVHLLGVRRGVFVITKADLVGPARLADVADEIRVITAGTALEGSPIVPFALPTGEGLGEIRAAIVRTLRDAGKPPPRGRFRLPVDRAFLSPGHGLIVTGTATNGEVPVGARVRCLPGGEVLRVRSIEVHGEPVARGTWGQRLALNLTGTTQAAVERGDVICDESLTLTCQRFDAVIEVRPAAARGLKNHQRVRVHLGTAEALGKVILMGPGGEGTPTSEASAPSTQVLLPGRSHLCQIVVTSPVVAMRGDHFILRDETAQRTLGGGRVVLPATPKRRRSDLAALQRLRQLASALSAGSDANDAHVLEAVVHDRVDSGEFAVALSRLAQLVNDTDERVDARARAVPALHPFTLEGETHFAAERACADVKTQVVEAVRAWHAAQPLSGGLDIEEARGRLARADPPPRVFRALIDEMTRDGALVREGSLLRLPTHRVQVTGGDREVVDRIAAALSANPLAPPDLKQVAADLKVDRTKLLPLLRVMEQQRLIVAVAPEMYFAADVVDRLRADLERDLGGGATLTTAAFRDRYQTSRKYAIPLLEYFDRIGVTMRVGEARRLRR